MHGYAHGKMVAAGTALAGGPPHRSQRAELPHRGSYLGCVAAKRACGNGCTVRVWGIDRVATRFILSQLIRVRMPGRPIPAERVRTHSGGTACVLLDFPYHST